jgi:ABC-type uncharacterized transport system ATPase subunit
MAAPAIEMRGIVKRFGEVQALRGVDLDLRPGEVHALLGENGAGKTTLMNILYGLHRPDAGTIAADGNQLKLTSPQDAIAAGIGMVHQHFMLVPTLTVAENMVLGQRGNPIIRKRDMRAVADRLTELGERYGLEVNPHARVWELSVGEQQRVEILRALYRDAKVLILDEPTATLTPAESDGLFGKLRTMASEGATVVFITHHLEEVINHADRITVLRLGERVGNLAPSETSIEELARLMVGRDVKLMQVAAGQAEAVVGTDGDGKAATSAGSPRLEVRDLVVDGDRGERALDGVSFSVGAGEILAIAGVEGNGQSQLEEVLFGLRAPREGSVHLEGEDITNLSPAKRLSMGIGLVPSDRYRRGLVRQMSVAENLVCDRIDKRPYGGFLRLSRRAIRNHGAELVDRYSIRVSGPGQLAGTLSGGNAQRVVLARALSRDLRGLIAAQPTRGLDVGAIEFVWEQLAAARDAGLGIVLISTDLDEVCAMADHVAVLYRGKVVATWPRERIDREQIGLAMGGAAPTPAKEVA